MQYPKMLYKGDQENYQTVIAYKEDHEAELIADGWADYGELPEYEPRSSGSVGSSAISDHTLIPVEQFDAVAQKLTETEDQLNKEREAVKKLTAKNKGLQDQVGELQDLVQKAFVESVDFQDQIAALNASIQNPEGTAFNPEPKVISLNDLTLAQLQEMAKSKGIEFKVRDSKGTLIELLMDYQDKELANADSN